MRRLVSAIETTAALSLLLIALVTAGNVVLRDLFAVQIPDWFDGSRMLMAIALFWGIAVTTWHASHICVDVLRERLGPTRRRVLDLVNGAIAFVFLAPMAWMVWAKVLSSGTQSTTDLRIPLIWFTGVAASGAVAAALLALLRLVRTARRQEPTDGS
ncbi:MAG: TRAP transporter small permease [Lautropia sp.]